MERHGHSDESEFRKHEFPSLTVEDIQTWIEKNALISAEGMENLQESGPMILAANHESSLDPFIIRNILSKMGRQDLDVLTKKESVSGPEEGIILTGEGWLEGCVESISQGKSILIFPEGAVSNEKRAHSGVTVLARQVKLPIVPIHIKGSSDFGSAEDVLGKIGDNENMKEPVNVLVVIGNPQMHNEPQDLVRTIYDL